MKFDIFCLIYACVQMCDWKCQQLLAVNILPRKAVY